LGYVIVLLLAVAAGGLVYWASMRFAGEADPSRADDPPASGTPRPGERGSASASADDGGTDDGDLEAPPGNGLPGTAYIPVVSARGSWQGRLGGVMGLVIAVVVAAATIAFVLYEAGHIISKLLSGATGSG
jgi:hypothetical protein